MRLARLTISSFQSFGERATTIELDDLTYVLGPNGAGKTAVLQALVRMFGIDPNLRRVRRSDFHVTPDAEHLGGIDQLHLWIEAEFELPEAGDESTIHCTVPQSFNHMQLEADDETPRVRIRLSATLDLDGEIEEKIRYVVQVDAEGNPVKLLDMSKHDRHAIQVHYLPARRDPSDHVSYAASSLLGRALRAANWSAERDVVGGLAEKINSALEGNEAVKALGIHLGTHWGSLHSGTYFGKPSVTFNQSEIDSLLRLLTVNFSPSPDGHPVSYSRLSDGQKSLLYMSLVLTMYAVGRDVLAGTSAAYDVDKLRPAIFTVIAVEEPENSLSPRYLGRIIKFLKSVSVNGDAQALMATHAPALLRRVPPEHIRYLRLNESRETTVKTILLPAPTAEAHKFVREAVQAFPELYFARVVVLGEGDSEEIVLPRVLAAKGIAEDDTSITVVPLGGRHVNHFWRLLHGLGIPHVTLLDFDLARHQGGWGRISNAAKKLKALSVGTGVAQVLTDEVINNIPKWDSGVGIPDVHHERSWLAFLEIHNVYFSEPIDLDFMMLEAYPKAYAVEDLSELEAPNEATIKAVLGKSHFGEEILGQDRLQFFDIYHQLFKLGSKPSSHIDALSRLSDEELLTNLPSVFERMLERIAFILASLPE
ncbi:MAG TPA: AAA family ATPase [Pseudonocardiaceae bacterium]|jgi:putative ATP-dependent endonuclease of OLD family|nr:AAA family ATPase [Pseudonocardiaceae bacterium]